jgi:DNA-binding FadR family transcriptional regulator
MMSSASRSATHREFHLGGPDHLKISERIAQQILGQIADGSLLPGNRLPTGTRLLEQLGAA